MLKSSQYGTSPSILLTGIRSVGKSALMKRIQKNFRDEKYLVIYIDLSSSNAYQTDEFPRESIIELIYNQIINECKEFGITTVVELPRLCRSRGFLDLFFCATCLFGVF